MLSRRAFLASTAAIALTPAIPKLSIAAPVAQAVEPATTIWVGGTPGEFDWQPFHARSRDDALRQLCHYHGLDSETEANQLALERAPKMDGLHPDEIKGHHWIKAGFGSLCSRCDGECDGSDGAVAIDTEVICEECLTLADRLALGYDDEVEERLIELMMDEDCDEAAVREVLNRDMDVDAIPATMWTKCLAEARAAA